MGKAFGVEQEYEGGQYVTYRMAFSEDTLYVRWNDGIDAEDHEYPAAAWTLTEENGYAVLTIDFREFSGVLRYNLMYDTEDGWLYTMVDCSAG